MGLNTKARICLACLEAIEASFSLDLSHEVLRIQLWLSDACSLMVVAL